jgi:hypothetical protein
MLPRQLRHVHQAVDAPADVDERTEVDDGGNLPAPALALLQALQELLSALAL